MKSPYLGFSALIFVAVVVVFRNQAPDAPPSKAPPGHATVVWISVDGFRHDYVQRYHPPFLSRMMAEGAYSTHMQTIFPSITFASHMSEVTGVTVTHHGIPANDFYDRVTKRQEVFPSDSSLVLAEPIWRTSTRQGVRTAVYDWPLSQLERGENVPAYSDAKAFDNKRNGDERMARLAETYEGDHGQPPLRLLMSYMEATDKPGHKYGPDAPETAAAVMEADRLLSAEFDRLYADFQRHRTSRNDTFYFLMTTDHGMTPVHTLVRMDFLLGLLTVTQPATAPVKSTAYSGTSAQPFGTAVTHSDVIVMSSGPLGYVYLPESLTGAAREARIVDYLQKLRAKPYIHAWRQEDLPAKWDFHSATRIGDIVVMLDEGYTFSRTIPLAEYPVEKGNGARGMHGYPVELYPDMEGFIGMWRDSDPWNGLNLGVVHATQFHATVAGWLGIQSAPGAAAPISAVEGPATK